MESNEHPQQRPRSPVLPAIPAASRCIDRGPSARPKAQRHSTFVHTSGWLVNGRWLRSMRRGRRGSSAHEPRKTRGRLAAFNWTHNGALPHFQAAARAQAIAKHVVLMRRPWRARFDRSKIEVLDCLDAAGAFLLLRASPSLHRTARTCCIERRSLALWNAAALRALSYSILLAQDAEVHCCVEAVRTDARFDFHVHSWICAGR